MKGTVVKAREELADSPERYKQHIRDYSYWSLITTLITTDKLH